MGELLEREQEVPVLRRFLAAVGGGVGGLVVLGGDAGLGKTRLLSEAVGLAREAGVRVLTARGSEMEVDYGYGVVRQLLELPVARMPGLLDGIAEIAAPVVDPLAMPVAEEDGADLAFVRMRALHLVCARLAEESPTALFVDDAHWADLASLRFLAFLARRVGDLPLGLMITCRPESDESRQRVIDGLLNDPESDQLRVRALSPPGVAALLTARRPADVDAEFVGACHEVTGGNPFLLDQLLREIDDLALAATASNASRVRVLGPDSIARSVLGRLRGTDASTVDAARWLAVLGDGSSLDTIAEIARLSADTARQVAVSLFEAGVVDADAVGGLRFVHPIVRSAIYSDLAPTDRARRHASSARLLDDRGEPTERIAAHVMAGECAGDPANVAVLRKAAFDASALGAPDAAVAYLRRALAEPPSQDERADVLRELARAEARTGDPATADHLLAAFTERDDVEFRADTAVELAASLMAADRPSSVASMVWDLADRLADSRPDLAIRVEAALLTTARFAPPFAGVVQARGHRIAQLLSEHGERNTAANRMILAALAFDSALTGQSAGETIALAEQALAGNLLPWDMGRSVAFGMAVHALVLSDALDSARRHLTWAIDRCRDRGSASGIAWAHFFNSLVETRRGALADAEASVILAIDTARVAGLRGWAGAALATLVEARLERGDVGGARDAYDQLIAERISSEVPIVVTWTLRSEGMMLREAGDQSRARAAFEQIGRVDATWNAAASAGYTRWRQLAATTRERGDEGARELAAADVAEARRIGLSCSLSSALRVSASLASSARDSMEMLVEAYEAASVSSSPLERAYACVALGAARRRASELVAARELCGAGLALAQQCGAERLVARARDELVAAGARPRRTSVSGPAALTASETRVVHLAVEGRSNAEIAAELVVTRKTVEMHLGRAYRKLGIRSRAQLPGALRLESA